jgi:pyruvate formate lyase activating enzyme
MLSPLPNNPSFKGWERTSLIEYPDHIATVLFCGGCDFRCPMCHNASLVLSPGSLDEIPHPEIWRFLAQRRRLVDAVVITGGEPTLQTGLVPFFSQAHKEGLKTKLDTNGYHPLVIHNLLSKGLVDYIAMDIKAPRERYELLTGLTIVEIGRIEDSINLILKSSIDYEFRTTVVPGLLGVEDVAAIAKWIKGAKKYFIQQFRPSSTLDPALESLSPPPISLLKQMVACASADIAVVSMRGTGG